MWPTWISWFEPILIAPFSGGSGWAWRLHLFALIAGLFGSLSFGSAAFCRYLSRRAERFSQPTIAAALFALSGPLRLSVILSGLYLLVDLSAPSGRATRIATGGLFVVLLWVCAHGLSKVTRILISGSLAHLNRRTLEEGGSLTRSQRALPPLLERAAGVLLWLAALVIGLDHFGQSISSVVAALGVGSLAIGLASQQALSNMIAGLVLIADRPFRAGDRIRILGLVAETGKVEEMGLRSTHIRLGDGNLLIVPNNDLVTARLINYTGKQGVRGDVRIQVPIALGMTEIETLEGQLLDAAREQEGVLPEPPPRLQVLSIGEKVDLSLTFVACPDHPGGPGELEERLRRVALRALGPLLPTPQPRTEQPR